MSNILMGILGHGGMCSSTNRIRACDVNGGGGAFEIVEFFFRFIVFIMKALKVVGKEARPRRSFGL